MKKLLVLSILFSLVLSPVFISCEKEEGDKAPELPPLSSLEMDFSAFSNEQKSAALTDTKWNWLAAATNLVFWNISVYAVSAIPVAAFAESFNHEAEFLGDATWQWQYSIPNDGDTITARLEGEIVTDSVEWRMYLSGNILQYNYDNFLWFKGRSANDMSGGWWILNEGEGSTNELLQIDWKHESDEIGSLKYTYVKPNVEDNGNYIMFEKYELDENNLDRRYSIFNVAKGKSTIIEWNSETTIGRINPFEEDVWKCWDENHNDADCE